MPLTKEQIDELLGLVDNKGNTAFYRIPGRICTNYPSRNGKYVRYSNLYLPCQSRGCKIPTYLRIQGLPFCELHGLLQMDLLMQQLIPQAVEDLNGSTISNRNTI